MPPLPPFVYSDDELHELLGRAHSRADVADLLAVPKSFLTHVLYRRGVDSFYNQWEIKKKAGDTRTIKAPSSSLYVLQYRLSRALQAIYTPKPCVHGFVPGRSTVTNAQEHLMKRFVLNVDLADFFPSLNFGRVRGVLLASPFDIGPEAATTMAQIACVDGALPIGGPTSPVISNMICMRLDGHLMKLAGTHQCWYTRYADDLTFSTRRTTFPKELAVQNERDGAPETTVGDELRNAIEQNGFVLNDRKTRLQTRDVRQAVTGVTVNVKLNVDRRYVRKLRAMLYSIETLGVDGAQAKFDQVDSKDRWNDETPSILDAVHGKLAYLQMVRGPDDPVLLRYRRQFENLSSGRPRWEGVDAIDAASARRHVFISYVREDAEAVDRIARDLREAGITYWRDTTDLPPGTHWKIAIKRAIRGGAVFLACFSSASVDKATSYMWEELNLAVEEIRRRPDDVTWFIPVLLDDCEMPDIDIRTGRPLSDIQASPLYRDWAQEMPKLIEAIRRVVEGSS